MPTGVAEQDRRERGKADQNQIQSLLQRIQLGESRLECDCEQKAGEDLSAGLHHTQFLHQFFPVAIGPLVRRLVAAVTAHGVAGCGIFSHATSIRGRQGGCPAPCTVDPSSMEA